MPSRSGRGHSEDPGTRSAPEGSRYVLREKLLSLGDDFWIENEHGERAFFVDDKVMRVRDTVVVKDRNGHELLKLQKRLLRVRDSMAIERGGDRVATIRKRLISPLRDRFTVDLAGGGELEVEGDILDHEYQITRDGIPVANVSKRWSGCATPTASRSPPARTTRSCSRSPCASTTSPPRTARPCNDRSVLEKPPRRRLASMRVVPIKSRRGGNLL
jgi:uncharacterized protein YxjI